MAGAVSAQPIAGAVEIESYGLRPSEITYEIGPAPGQALASSRRRRSTSSRRARKQPVIWPITLSYCGICGSAALAELNAETVFMPGDMEVPRLGHGRGAAQKHTPVVI